MKNKYLEMIENNPHLKKACIVLKKTEYVKDNTGMWKRKSNKENTKKITYDIYRNSIDAIPFFENLGGREEVSIDYTFAGNIPVEIASISPDGTQKTVRVYYIIKSEKEARELYNLEF
jgi:hypothetical protein